MKTIKNILFFLNLLMTTFSFGQDISLVYDICKEPVCLGYSGRPYIFNELFYYTDEQNTWVFDGTNPAKIAYDFIAYNPYVFGHKVYLTTSGRTLWEYGGSSTPKMIKSFKSAPFQLTGLNGELMFTANDSIHGMELWAYDGAKDPALLAYIIPGLIGSYLYNLEPLNNKLYFTINDSLWVYDGVNPPVKDTLVGSDASCWFVQSDRNDGKRKVYAWDPGTENYSKEFDFNNAEYGRNPMGSLIQARNGKLYGMFSSGGDYGLGVLFELDHVTNSLIKKIDFDGEEKGSIPCGSLIEANNGKFYGMTNYGGLNDDGILFEWDSETNILTKKIDFEEDANGRNPQGSLIQASNGMFYGLTLWGGLYDCGVLFEWDRITNTFIKKFDFDWDLNGGTPCNSLMQANNGKLYGLTHNGGSSNQGVLFEWDPVSNIFTKKYDFSGVHGYYPYGSLLQEGNDKLFGIATWGGTNGEGTIFEWDLTTDAYTVKYNFKSQEGGVTQNGSLIQAENGKFYSVSRNGGTNNQGSLFEWDPVTSNYSKKTDLEKFTTGRYPEGGLLEVNKFSHTIISESSCQKYSSPSGKYTWTVSGVYTDTVSNSSGCDSIITINLEIKTINTSVSINSSTLQALLNGAEYQWVNCNDNYAFINGAVTQSFTPQVSGNYAVIVSNGSCVDTSAVYTVIVTDISEPAYNGITLYPNPNIGSFTIDLGRVCVEAVVTITAPDGQLIQSKNARNTRNVELDLAAPPGLYMVTVAAEKEKTVFKVVKNINN